MSDSRDRFEAWCKKENIPTTLWAGLYKDDRAFVAWTGWQACEASLKEPLACEAEAPRDFPQDIVARLSKAAIEKAGGRVT